VAIKAIDPVVLSVVAVIELNWLLGRSTLSGGQGAADPSHERERKGKDGQGTHEDRKAQSPI